MAKDHELDWLIGELEAIPHLKRLRIHSRLPVVIPARITETLCQRLGNSRLQVLMVTHINHAQEIDGAASRRSDAEARRRHDAEPERAAARRE